MGRPGVVERDVAVVLSGGAVNGVLMELGFLQRLRASALWPRIGWIYGTSAGALSGTMAALDRLDELEDFMLRLQPEETFRPHSLWRLPLLGSHDYRLPETVEERLGDVVSLARDLAASPIEVTVVATDVSEDEHGSGQHAYELAYSSRTTPPEEMAQAILASAAISALVLPRRVGDRIATDGAWVRNFPLGHAYGQPGVQLIVSFRYLPRYPRIGTEGLARLRRRLERFPKVPPVRALVAELRDAEARGEHGEPAHWPDMIVRLMRVAIQQNTVLEERVARDKDEALRALEELRRDVDAIVRREGGRRGGRVARAVAERFDSARFPFLGDRAIPRIAVQSTAGEVSLETGLRNPQPWTEEAKRSLIRRGYELLDGLLVEEAVA
ncbi:MAG TPA: patatin-like phospholipase family protein [Gaiellaceae bacterium]|nr:patatin-like phospholipase family protein [Gaiellaceae bacterium]